MSNADAARLLLLALVVAAPAQTLAQRAPATRPAPPEAAKAAPDTRRADLLRGLTAINDAVRVRSLHELAESGLYDDTFCRALVRYAREADDFHSLPTVPILAAGGAKIVPAILEGLRGPPPTIGIPDPLMLSLGRMGPEAKEAVPELRRMLADENRDEEERILIRTVLAAIGGGDADNQAKLQQWLRTRSEQGQKVVSFLALIGAQHWPDKEACTLLLPWFDGKPSEESANAALALASLGTNAAPAATEIQRRLNHVDEQWATLRILYGTALARIFQPGSAAQKKAYRDMLSYLGEAGNHTDWAALSMVAHTLVESNLVAQTVNLLGDAEDSIAHGAVRMLAELGKPSSLAASKMITLLRKAKTKDFSREEAAYFSRDEIARALGFVLPATDIGQLEQVLAAEKDYEVRKGLENALCVVSLGKVVVGASPRAALDGATDENLTAILVVATHHDTRSDPQFVRPCVGPVWHKCAAIPVASTQQPGAADPLLGRVGALPHGRASQGRTSSPGKAAQGPGPGSPPNRGRSGKADSPGQQGVMLGWQNDRRAALLSP